MGGRIVLSESEPGEPTWMNQANCLGCNVDLFFPNRGASVQEAKAVCRGCEVRVECLTYALTNGEKWGIWGGLSERERRRIRSFRRRSDKVFRQLWETAG